MITVEVDGEEDFSVIDDLAFFWGKIALRNWGSRQIEYRNVRLRRAPVEGKEAVER